MNFYTELKRLLEEHQREGLASIVLAEMPSEDPQTTNASLAVKGMPSKLIELLAHLMLDHEPFAEIVKQATLYYIELKAQGEGVSDGDTV